jgi:hypothetical protein
MKCIASANTLLDAQLIADTLASIGIQSHILNAHAVGAMGELPYSQTRPQIWIDDSALEARAREAIAGLDAAAPAHDKQCAHCGETNPGNFLSCWHCASALAG